jgi:hypothetical protein
VRAPSPALPQPSLHHNLAVHIHPSDATATSRSRRGHAVEAFPRAPIGRHTHAHTHSHLLHQIRAATPDPTETDVWARAVSKRGGKSRRNQPARRRRPSREEKKKEGPAHGGEEAGPRRNQAEPFFTLSQPAARAGLLSRRPS